MDTIQIDNNLPEQRYDLRILQSLRRIIRAIDLNSKKLVQSCNLTSPQLVCLLEIADKKELSVAKLAKNVFLSPSTMVGILDRLEDKGLILRERSKKDRRLVLIKLSDKGTELVENAPSPLQDRLSESLNNLPSSQQLQIMEALEKLIELMEAEDIDAAPILDTGKV